MPGECQLKVWSWWWLSEDICCHAVSFTLNSTKGFLFFIFDLMFDFLIFPLWHQSCILYFFILFYIFYKFLFCLVVDSFIFSVLLCTDTEAKFEGFAVSQGSKVAALPESCCCPQCRNGKLFWRVRFCLAHYIELVYIFTRTPVCNVW